MRLSSYNDELPSIFIIVAVFFYGMWAAAGIYLQPYYYDAPFERIACAFLGIILFIYTRLKFKSRDHSELVVALYAGLLYLHFFSLALRAGISETYALGLLIFLAGSSLLFFKLRHYLVFAVVVLLTQLSALYVIPVPQHRIIMLIFGLLTIAGTAALLLHIRVNMLREHHQHQLIAYSEQKREIGEQLAHYQRQAATYKQKAYYDALTELPNRDYFLDALSRSFQYAQRHDAPLAVLFCDLDGFKPINDNYGHDAGDRILQQFARRFHQSLHTSDLCARYAGDEFTAVLPGIRTTSDIRPICERLLTACAEPLPIHEGVMCTIGLSIGIVVYPDPNVAKTEVREPADLIFLADVAMYEAKRSGKNRWVAFNNELSKLSRITRAVTGQEVLSRNASN